MYERTYHEKVLKQDTNTVSKKRFPWKRIMLSIGGVLLIVGGVFLIRVPQFQIRTVTVTGTNVADPIDVSQFVLGELEGTYLFVLPKSSILLASPKKITARISDRFPRFKEVDVKRDSMRSLSVAVTEYPGAYLWCDSEDVCSFMDETGTVFADAPYFSGSAYVKLYGAERQPYPFYPITAEQLATMRTIATHLEAIDIDPIEFHFDTDRKTTVVFSHRGTRATILFDPNRDVLAALDVLYSGLRTDPLKKMYHDQTQVLEYLDLRFSNKVVYKFQ